ncbi:deoxycytidyl transferase [Podila verticillata]|nr:deoxycytidyl transferase [Podila verticillata]
MAQESNDDPFQAIGYGDFGTYIKNKRAKLQLQFDETAALADPDTPQIFEGLVIYVNGYTYPPIQELRKMIVQRGGEWCQFLSKSSITHIIATNLTQAKMKEFRNYKVAKPEWITESIKANRLLAWHKFSALRIPASTQTFGFTSSGNQSKGSFVQQRPQATPVVSQSTTVLTRPSDNILPLPFVSPDLIPTPSEAHVAGKKPDDTEWNEYGFGDSIELEGLNLSQEFDQATSDQWRSDELNDPLDDDELFKDLDLYDFEQDFSQGSPVARTEETPATITQAPSPFRPQHLPPRTIGDTNNPWKPSRPNPFKDNLRASPTSSIPPEEPTQSHMPDDIPSPATVENDTRHPTLIELSVPWNRLNSSVQPGFVEKFYQSSRLHYLSTWKAKLRDLTAHIQKNHVPVPMKSKNRVIMHIDFDCFFASVATRGKPELLNKPIGVAHGSGGSTSNSEIASCNYLARDFGVKNGMHLQRARSLCPDLVVVPYEFQQYEDISIEFYKILLTYSDELQAVSVDEALVDVTSKCQSIWEEQENARFSFASSSASSSVSNSQRMDPGEFAQRIRDEVFEATGCHASVGVGPNVLLAKLSTKRAKPHGQYIWPSAPGSERTLKELQGDQGFPSDQQSLTPEDEQESRVSLEAQDTEPPEQAGKAKRTPKGLSVKDLPGVGYKTAQELEERFQVTTLHGLQRIPRESLQSVCGMKTGGMLYNSCRGIDETTLASDRDKARQSVSAEISWGVRFENQQQLESFIRDLAVEVSKRLKEIDRMAKSLVVKIMKRKAHFSGQWKHMGHGPCDQFARTGNLPRYTDDPELIAREALNLINYFRFDVLDLRGIGIQMMKLNNETINFMDKSSYSSMDNKNQTTLSAMFQPKSSATGASSSTSGLGTGRSNSGPKRDSPPPQPKQPEPLPPPEPRPLPPMEIDSITFKELPLDIQEELRRHYTLVFIDSGISSWTTINKQPLEEDNFHHHDEHPGDISIILPPSPRPVPMGPPRTPPNRARNEMSTSSPPPEGTPSTLTPWSQLDPAELAAMSTPAIRHTLHEYAERKSNIPPPPRRGTKRLMPDNDNDAMEVLPSPSQLDMSVLQALPKEIRDEIEQEYTHIKENHRLIQQFAHPGPGPGVGPSNGGLLNEDALTRVATDYHHGVRANSARGRGTRGRPRGRSRGRVRGGGESSRPHRDLDEGPEDNLAPHRIESRDDGHSVPLENISGLPALDPEFLAALPPDIRTEVENEHQVAVLKHRQKLEQQQQQQQGGTKKQQASRAQIDEQERARAPQIERPTLMGLRDVEPLRRMLSDWVQSTLVPPPAQSSSSPAEEILTFGVLVDEGPNPEDVQSFSDFVARVIYMERDLERVRVLLAWLRRKIEWNERKTQQAMFSVNGSQKAMTWRQALERILGVVNRLVEEVYGGVFELE